MAFFDFLGRNKLPEGLVGSTLIIADSSTLQRAAAFISLLQAKFHNVALAATHENQIEPGSDSAGLPFLQLPVEFNAALERLQKIKPQRLILIGLSDKYIPYIEAADCPAYWINAQDAGIAKSNCQTVCISQPLEALPDALVTGDPLADIAQLPALVADADICLRFKEQRQGDRWLGYFAATGESEEEIAYALFNRAMRHKMGLMLLAPRDPERCEPVYRESIKYQLQTIRHRRLSTSFVPIKTRVYYIEDPEPLEALYACADFVVTGATLHPDALNSPDIVTPILNRKPVLVGSANRQVPLLAAAIEAKVVLSGLDNEQLFNHLKALIDQPEYGNQIAERALAWLHLQVGAAARVLALIA